MYKKLPTRSIVALCASLLLGALAWTAGADDRDLLRQNEGDPFLFILLDSSSSMNLDFDDDWVHAGGDDPRSRLYAAKQTLYQILRDLPGIHYGFSTFNQDLIRVTAKHWLYFVPGDPGSIVGTNNVAQLDALQTYLTTVTSVTAADPESRYPLEEADGQIEVPELDLNGDPTGYKNVEISGDMMTFGPEIGLDAGKCNAPLDLATQREMINRYPQLGTPAGLNVPPEMYVEVGGKTFRIITTKTGVGNLANSAFQIEMLWQEIQSCANISVGSPEVIDSTHTVTLTLRRWKAFLLQDDGTGATAASGNAGCGASSTGTDSTGGWWPTDSVKGTFECATQKPHSGGGWEGNYDTGPPPPLGPSNPDEALVPGYDPSITLVDTHCKFFDCQLDLQETTYSSILIEDVRGDRTAPPGQFQDTRELDWGDTITWNWDDDYKDEFLSRLNPNHLNGPADFGVADYFEDEPDLTGRYPLRGAAKPIIPAGISPVGNALLDFRCWAVGEPNESKCDSDQHGAYDTGWLHLFEDHSDDLALCRVPYVIVISDLYTNCTGASHVSEVAGMYSDTGTKVDGGTGISTWVFNVGPGKCNGLTGAGRGEAVDIDSRATLRKELEDVLGIILEEQRTFAAAAVPSVQADVGDSIYFTKFVPLQGESVWPGQALAYPKPIPLDRSVDPPIPADGAELWDAAKVLSTTQVPYPSDIEVVDSGGVFNGASRSELRIGLTATTRRVYYSNLWDGSGWTQNPMDIDRRPFFRNLLGPAVDFPPSTNENDVRRDLWSGMGIISLPFTFSNDPADLADLYSWYPTETGIAHEAFKDIYAMRTATVNNADGTTFTVEYSMGDVFHSNPVIIDSPRTAGYFGNETDFPGYETFSLYHERRRKILVFGANDGLLHVFDAGTFELDLSTPEDSRFNDGTGTEIFAYVPRAQLPTMYSRVAPLANSHEWGVDGSPVASDVFIDPWQPTGVADPDERQWRTVLAFGLRRGGRSYTVLDITHPDRMTTFQTTSVTGATIDRGYRPVNEGRVADCMAQGLDGRVLSGACNTAPITNVTDPTLDDVKVGAVLPYGTPLFEFVDNNDDEGLGTGNGEVDLGQTWSTPNLGAIRVLDGTGAEEIRYVMIFGGGLPSSGTETDPSVDVSGNWLYMVDIETGKPIYKRQLMGAAPAEPASVDTDGDGVLDRIYIGTLAGFMYRVDMSNPVPLATCSAGLIADAGKCIESADWDPIVLFDAGRRPIYFRPAVTFLADLGSYGLVFGTGDRETLWASAPVDGNRFYSFADEVCPYGVTSPACLDPLADLPLTENDLVDTTGAVLGDNPDYLNDPDIRGVGEKGWFMRLGLPQPSDTISLVDPSDELVVTPAFVVSGVLVFSTFIPNVEFDSGLCSRRGVSRNYIALVTNGEPLLDTISTEAETLVTEPFIQPTSTDRECGQPGEPACPPTNADPCAGTERISDILKERVFPDNCRYSPTLSWEMQISDTKLGISCLARIPTCILESNWKDF